MFLFWIEIAIFAPNLKEIRRNILNINYKDKRK